ncbi:MAG: cell division protein FtsW [Omnitrophica WOR_2 bacterium RIFCSPHIGHO2_02_FULL_48_11]|nr:MAG: cell division protein FtsW [Omnitrophica WOR_2 bacterium RIFCSPHIGHO2_02_FULL_48_11]
MRDIRISLATVVMILICVGIVMIYSSSGIYALQELGDSAYFLHRHLLFLFAGTICAAIAMSLDYRELQKWSKLLAAISIIVLILVLIPGIGKASYGARRWFQVAGFSFQPSEFAKLALLIYVADFLARKQIKIKNFKEGFLPVMIVLGMFCLPILKQPDLGTPILMVMITLVLLFIAGARVWHIGMLGVMTLPLLYLLIVKYPYRLARIMAFLDPWQDSRGVGFQLAQSQIALGSGGFWGVGLGKSMQKLFYLPAAHTDFILSIIGEELGFLGTLAVILLFVVFIWQGARIAKRTTDAFGYFLSAGIVAMIGMQAVINVGVSIGALPTKGLPLPFISYGGSALIFNMVAVGLLLNISRTQDL